MKGIVYTELFEFIENEFGLAMVDEICNLPNLASGGVYTAVGTYPDEEAHIILDYVIKKTELTSEQVLHSFGRHLFYALINAYPHIVERFDNTFKLLQALDSFIHPTVKKLYPDANLPKFVSVEQSENHIVLEYISDRHMHDLAHGLILSCIEHYKEDISVQMTPSKASTLFLLQKL